MINQSERAKSLLTITSTPGDRAQIEFCLIAVGHLASTFAIGSEICYNVLGRKSY